MPQAPQVDPRMFALDAQGALLSAQAGIHLGTELASLQNLQGKLELEKAEIAAKKAKNEYDRQAAEHAITTLPQMVQTQVDQAKAASAQALATQQIVPSTTAATIASAQAGTASSQSAFAQTQAEIKAGIPQFRAEAATGEARNALASVTAATDFSKLSPQEKTRQLGLAKTAGELGAESVLPKDVQNARQFVMFALPLSKQRQEIAQTNAVAMAQKLRIPPKDFTNADGTYDFDLIQKKWDDAKVSDPLSVYGDMPGFKESYSKAKDLRQTQIFLDEVPNLLKAAGDPNILQKSLDDFRDTKGSSFFKAAFGAAAAQNVDEKTAARSALIDLIDMKLGGALNTSGESRALKNSLQVQAKDSNAAILAVVNRYRPTVDRSYEASKEGLPSEAFQGIDDGSAFKPKSLGDVARGRLGGGSQQTAPNYTPTGETRELPGKKPEIRVKLANGQTGWIPAP